MSFLSPYNNNSSTKQTNEGDITKYPEGVQKAIKEAQFMDRQGLINYFNNLIKYYEDYNRNNPNRSWAKEYPQIYREKKEQVLKEFDEKGIACYKVDYNHFGHGFDCEDIDVYLYTDGTYKVSKHSYSAY